MTGYFAVLCLLLLGGFACCALTAVLHRLYPDDEPLPGWFRFWFGD